MTTALASAERNLRRSLRPPAASLAPLAPALTTRARAARVAGTVVLILVAATLPYALRWAGPPYSVDYGLVIAMIVLAISVLGWIGEISLAPVAQMGVGVLVLSACQQAEVPFGLTFPIVALTSVPISLVLAAFTLRMKGVSFAIATLAFAYMAHKTFFQTQLGTYGAFGATTTEDAVVRPGFIASDNAFYYLLLAILLAMAGVCYAIQRSRIGTRLTALRESEMAFSVLGHPPAAYRFFTICLSGAIASIAGACLGYLQLLVPAEPDLLPAKAVLYFGFAVAGGLGSVGGAILAGAFFGALPKYLETLTKSGFLTYDLFFIGLAVFLIMLKAPDGLAGIGRRLWRRIEGNPT
jgi:branched-chain amino acid transport system permease protein